MTKPEWAVYPAAYAYLFFLQVERRQTDSEKTDKRAVRAALLVDTSDLKALETAKDHEKKRTILSYEEAFKSIMEAANVTSIEVRF